MNTNNTDKPMEWEKEFDWEYLKRNLVNENSNPMWIEDYVSNIKKFISQAIQATREDIEKKRDADINTLNVEFPDYIGVHPVESMHPRKAWLEARIGVCRELLDSLTNKSEK